MALDEKTALVEWPSLHKAFIIFVSIKAWFFLLPILFRVSGKVNYVVNVYLNKMHGILWHKFLPEIIGKLPLLLGSNNVYLEINIHNRIFKISFGGIV